MKNPIKFMASNLLLATGSAYSNPTISKNATDTIEWNNGTVADYTSPVVHHDRHLQAHNYTGHYDPTKHNHEQNVQRAIQAKIIRARDELKVTDGIKIIEDKNWKILIRKHKDKLSISIEPTSKN
jgi:hypothetical protein